MAMQMQKAAHHGVKMMSNGRSMSSSLLISNGNATTPSAANKAPTKKLHVTTHQNYPQAATLPLPPNIDPTECTRFSPQRSRDITSNTIGLQFADTRNAIDVTLDNSASKMCLSDPHVASYDCNGAISLNSVMQSNVPEPFGGMHKFTHLNMPGGSWEQTNKFLSHDLQSSHYTNLRQKTRENWSAYDQNSVVVKKGITSHKREFSTSAKYFALVGHLNNKNNNWPFITNTRNCRHFSNLNKSTDGASASLQDSGEKEKKPDDDKPLSRKDQLKKAVKEYGSTVIVFHVAISLTSLGTCYLLVSSGLDVVAILDRLGLETLSSKAAAGAASTFVIAYAIHKVFAPVRISITLGATPFIVRYLRKKGILKSPKTQS